jgi:O-antigen/teichoic acid export membrane protein
VFDRPTSAPGHPAGSSGGDTVTRGLIGVTAAGWLGNIGSYLLLLAAARLLDAADYGELVTLFNLLLVGSVPSFALQAVAARRMATGQADGLWQAGLAVGFGAAVLIAASTPLLVAFLHLPTPAGVLLVALSMPGTAVQGLCQGVLQGEQRFGGLAATTFAGITGKSAGGLIGLFAVGGAVPTMLAIWIGVSVAGALSVLPLPELRRHGRQGLRMLRPLLAECGHASHAYGVFLLLSVCDVLLARHVLPSSAAAVYAAGSILTKATLWLPQSVANVLFASLTDTERHHRVFGRAVASIAGLALALVALSWLFGPLAATVVGGDRYPQLGSQIWLFAVLGGCLAVVQFTLVAGLAVRNVAVTALIWLTVAAEVVTVLALVDHPSVREVIGLVCLINLLSAGCAVALRLLPRSRNPSRP